MGGFDLADLLSVGVGYGYGHGYLDKLKLTPSRFHQWEELLGKLRPKAGLGSRT
jgi:hypothetical protein